MIGIGAEKSASSWLWTQLRAHPQIAAPPLKELNYFNAIDLGVDTSLRGQAFGGHWINRMWRHALRHHMLGDLRRGKAGDLGWYLRYFFGRRSDAWYRSLFLPGPGQVSGEFTPNYSAMSPAGVARVRRVAPDARIIFIMRDPIDRTWSATKMTLAGKRGRPFEEVTEAEIDEYLERPWEAELSNYVRTLRLWSEAFGWDRVMTGFHEEVAQSPIPLLERTCRFIGLDWDPAVGAGAEVVVNRSLDPEPAIPPHTEQLLARRYAPMLEDLLEMLPAEQRASPSRWLDRAKQRST